ncbi:hypothetical protein GCM10007859_26540 [Brevundimonas denitrificans]|uniref:Uncharacterized protein n=1 Tax=Brevundimonas denitrificans TaxID=1443434 RepID=A0ABQ6BKQ3_9CAUL|nr:hypothetical protein [Brevundimonas denitrificans]GLS02625.1 hypothetical protein GCM10007859_26540 [Brevundimonas denitrificans]
MTAIKTLTAAAAAALTLAAAGVASAQTPYSAAPYSQTPQEPSQGGRVLEAILGTLFGQGQTSLDTEWSRGRRPLYNQRTAFETRLDAGVRDGSLSYSQATRLRADYADLVALETRYAADGRFTTAERTELTDRYRDLTRRLDSEDYDDDDGDYGRWDRLADQAVAFDARVAAALRARDITRTEATRLRSDFQALVRLEAQYERDGLSDRERQDLETRYADLNRRVGDDYVPGNGGGVYGDPHAMQIEARIAAGLRDGSITRADAARYREELRDLSRRWADLEARVSVRR